MEQFNGFGWRRPCLGCVAALMIVPPAAAVAQDDFISKYTSLSTQDISLVREAARSLYEDTRPQVLDEASWSSAESGANGTVKIVSVSAEEDCILLRHEVQEVADGPQKELEIQRCKTSNGEWEISE